MVRLKAAVSDGGAAPWVVALVGEDPLALATLAPALARFRHTITAAPSRVLPTDVDVVVFDLGLEPRALLERHRGLFAEHAVLALVQSESEVGVLLAAGARAVLDRHVAPRALAAAVGAVAEGLVVLDADMREALIGAPRRDADLPALTAREREVLELMAQGLSNRGIAAALGVSEHTAKFHVNAILSKLDAATRTEAVVTAARSGLLLL